MADAPRPRILIVEDDAAIREGLELNLSLEGYETLSVGDGDSAEAIMATEQVELVLPGTVPNTRHCSQHPTLARCSATVNAKPVAVS